MNLLTRTWRAFGTDHCAEMAAAIAYYVLFSFVPLVTLLIAVFGLIMRDPAQQQGAVDGVLRMMPLQAGSGSNLVVDSIHNVSSQSGTLTLIGLAGLLWASSGMFGAIRAALNIAWDVKGHHGFMLQKLRDIAAVLGLGLLLVASLVGTTALHFVQTLSVQQTGTILTGPLQTFWTVAGLLVPAVFSFVAFLLLYRYVPNVRHSVGDVWPGALLATVLFELSKHGFAYYVAHFNRYQAVYGALGGVMLFMLWTYLAAMIMLIGAELAAARDRARHITPERGELAPPHAFAPGGAGR